MSKILDINEFIKHHDIVSKCINDNHANASDSFRYVNKYLKQNSDSPESMIVKGKIIKYISNDVFKKEFLEFVDNDTYLENEKMLGMTYYFPFKFSRGLFILENLLGDGETRYTYDNFFEIMNDFLEKEGANQFTPKRLEIIHKFMRENEAVMKIYKTLYDYIPKQYPNNLEHASELYTGLIIPYNDGYYERYLKSFNPYIDGDSDPKNAYTKHITGALGEWYMYNELKDKDKFIFASKDVLDGVGFDQYYQSKEGDKTIENLVEVKAKGYKSPDKIYMSHNEYDKMVTSKDKDQVDYSISRVFINNPNGNNIDHEILHLNDEGHLKSENGLEYQLEKKDTKKLVFGRTNERNYY